MNIYACVCCVVRLFWRSSIMYIYVQLWDMWRIFAIMYTHITIRECIKVVHVHVLFDYIVFEEINVKKLCVINCVYCARSRVKQIQTAFITAGVQTLRVKEFLRIPSYTISPWFYILLFFYFNFFITRLYLSFETIEINSGKSYCNYNFASICGVLAQFRFL